MRTSLALAALLLAGPTPALAQGLAPLDSVLAIFNCYATHIGLTQQSWVIEFESTDLGGDTIATTKAEPKYLRAKIRVDSTHMAEMADFPRRQIAIHELLHIVFWEAMDLARQKNRAQASLNEEKLITFLARRPFWYLFCTWPTDTTSN